MSTNDSKQKMKEEKSGERHTMTYTQLQRRGNKVYIKIMTNRQRHPWTSAFIFI